MHAELNHLKGQQARTIFATQCVNLVLYVRDITDQYKALIFTNLHDLCSNNNNSGNESRDDKHHSLHLYRQRVVWWIVNLKPQRKGEWLLE